MSVCKSEFFGQTLLVFGHLFCVSVGSGTLTVKTGLRSPKFCQFSPHVGTFLSSLSCRAQCSCLGTEDGQWRPVLLWISAANIFFFGRGVVLFYIFSPKCDRQRSAGPEITVTEITPSQEAKKGKANGTRCLHGDGRGVARKPQDLKMHMT